MTKAIKNAIYRTMMDILPKKQAYSLEYYRQYRRKVNFDEPKRLSEKWFWCMRYNEIYLSDLIKLIYDKHTVREYLQQKGLEHILVHEIGHYKDADEIDFTKLPKEFVLKATQSCGQNIICGDKEKLNEDEIKKKINQWIHVDKASKGELMKYYYTNDESIVCQELLQDKNGKIPNDIKFSCFNGEPEFIWCDLESVDDEYNKRELFHRETFDSEWNYLPIDFVDRPRLNKDKPVTEKPENLSDMLDIARKLSEDFVYMRVDLYNVDGKIYLGELTPIPGFGVIPQPDEYDTIFGEKLKLPDVKIF